MISLSKSVKDLELVDALTECREGVKAILDCYALAIDSAAHYAVEVDPAQTDEYRQHLRILESQARAIASPAQLTEIQSSFRGELREYHDKSAEVLKRMRQEIENATRAMMSFADTIAINGDHHGHEVNVELRRLEAAARNNSIEEIRCGVGAAVHSIASSVELMQRANQVVVAQLQDEIRVLHQEIAVERKTLYTDRESGAWTHKKIEMHTENLLRQNQPFSLLLIQVRNFKRLKGQLTRTVFEGTLQALFGRLLAFAGDDSVVGRWTDDQFVAVMDIQPGKAASVSTEANSRLSGTYLVQDNGIGQKVSVLISVCVTDRIACIDVDKFRVKLERLSDAISRG